MEGDHFAIFFFCHNNDLRDHVLSLSYRKVNIPCLKHNSDAAHQTKLSLRCITPQRNDNPDKDKEDKINKLFVYQCIVWTWSCVFKNSLSTSISRCPRQHAHQHTPEYSYVMHARQCRARRRVGGANKTRNGRDKQFRSWCTLGMGERCLIFPSALESADVSRYKYQCT